MIEHAILNLESLDICFQSELAELIIELIFHTLVEQNIHIDDKFFTGTVMGQNFFKEIVFVLLEKSKRVFCDLDHLSPPQQMHCPYGYLFQVYTTCSKDFLCNIVSFFINSTDLDDLIRCEIR